MSFFVALYFTIYRKNAIMKTVKQMQKAEKLRKMDMLVPLLNKQ